MSGVTTPVPVAIMATVTTIDISELQTCQLGFIFTWASMGFLYMNCFRHHICIVSKIIYCKKFLQFLDVDSNLLRPSKSLKIIGDDAMDLNFIFSGRRILIVNRHVRSISAFVNASEQCSKGEKWCFSVVNEQRHSLLSTIHLTIITQIESI